MRIFMNSCVIQQFQVLVTALRGKENRCVGGIVHCRISKVRFQFDEILMILNIEFGLMPNQQLFLNAKQQKALQIPFRISPHNLQNSLFMNTPFLKCDRSHELSYSEQFEDFIQIRNSLEACLANHDLSITSVRLRRLVQKISPYLGKTPQMQLITESNKRSQKMISLKWCEIKEGKDNELINSLGRILIQYYQNDRFSGEKCRFDKFASLLEHQNSRVVEIGIKGIRIIYQVSQSLLLYRRSVLAKIEYLLQISDSPVIVFESVKILSLCIKNLRQNGFRVCFIALLKFITAQESMNYKAPYLQALATILEFMQLASGCQLQLIIDSGVLRTLSKAVLSEGFPQLEKQVLKMILALLNRGLQSQIKAICRSASIDKLMQFGLLSFSKEVRLDSCQILIKMAKSSRNIEAIYSKQLLMRLLLTSKTNDNEVAQKVRRALSRILRYGRPAFLREFTSIYGRKIIEQCCESYWDSTDQVVITGAVKLMMETCRAGRYSSQNQPLIVLNETMGKMTAQGKAILRRDLQNYEVMRPSNIVISAMIQ